MADEALKSVEVLVDKIPVWIAELDSIVAASAEVQKAALGPHQQDASPASGFAELATATKSKSSSLFSRRSKDNSSKEGHADSFHASAARRRLPQTTQPDAPRPAPRPQKAISILSNLSTPRRFRSRPLVVVYFDSDTQKRFETVVRTVGTSRNILRKGKMSAKVDFLARMSSVDDNDSDSDDDPSLVSFSTKRREPRTDWARPMPPSKKDGSQIFDAVDGFLEKAQTLCEKAAHQILRDGECHAEINRAKQHFLDAQKTGQAGLPRLRRMAEKSATHHRRSIERARAEEDACQRKLVVEPAINLVVSPAVTTSPAQLLEIDIEAAEDDDDRDDSNNPHDLDISATFGKLHLRTARFAAL